VHKRVKVNELNAPLMVAQRTLICGLEEVELHMRLEVTQFGAEGHAVVVVMQFALFDLELPDGEFEEVDRLLIFLRNIGARDVRTPVLSDPEMDDGMVEGNVA
jgi:hypothetical protein